MYNLSFNKLCILRGNMYICPHNCIVCVRMVISFYPAIRIHVHFSHEVRSFCATAPASGRSGAGAGLGVPGGTKRGPLGHAGQGQGSRKRALFTRVENPTDLSAAPGGTILANHRSWYRSQSGYPCSIQGPEHGHRGSEPWGYPAGKPQARLVDPGSDTGSKPGISLPG